MQLKTLSSLLNSLLNSGFISIFKNVFPNFLIFFLGSALREKEQPILACVIREQTPLLLLWKVKFGKKYSGVGKLLDSLS